MSKLVVSIIIVVFALLSNGMAQAVYDVTSPGDVVMGVPDDGDWPVAERPELAIDDDVNTKYLHFKGDFNPNAGPTGLRVTPSSGPTIVTGLTFSTANDYPGRDPVSFELYGSNGTIYGPYTLIASGDILDFRGVAAWPRLTKNNTPITFPNDADYKHYQLLFTAIRGPVGGGVNSMQIAEVEMLRVTLVASQPLPADGTICTNNWINLSWMPGDLASLHNVYFGTDMDAVTQRKTSVLIATTDVPFALVGRPGYAFPNGLQMGTTYYWCVDEVNSTEPDSPWQGNIWSFRFSTEPAVYLLITNEKLAPAFEPLVQRRAEQGFPGRLLKVEYIYASYLGTDEPEKIRNCIIDHYTRYGTQYVALGGDDVIVPVRYCYTGVRDDIQPADLYYSDMDGGDWDGDGDHRYGEPGDVGEVELIPDVHLGRIPVRTVDDTAAYVNKVITYESATPELYVGSVLLAGGGGSPDRSGSARPPGFQDHDPVAHFEAGVTSWYLASVQPYWQGLPVHRHFPTHSSWDQYRCGDAEWSPEALARHLNEGYHLVLYGGHGAPTAWGMGGQFFRSSHAAQLTNPFPSIIVSVGCSLAAFDLAEPSLSEGFLRNPNGGAVAFFGFTRSGASGTSRTELSSELFRNKQTSIGEAMTRSQSTMASRLVGAPWRQCQFSFQGDPLIYLIPEREGRHLQIFQPKGLETIQRSSDLYIRWNAAGTGFGANESVRLEYSTDSGQKWYTVPQAEALPYNDRLFIWNDCDLPFGSAYRIRVSSLSDPEVSDMSERDFTVGELGLMKIRSYPVKSIRISGVHGNWTNYDISALLGEKVSLVAPLVPENVPEMVFERWCDEVGNTLTDEATYTFTFDHDTTVVAHYESSGQTVNYYVNDDTPEDGVAAGNDQNNGSSPQQPMRHIQALLDKYPELGWGDVINVSSGIYHENITLGESHAGLTLSGSGQDTCVIDGGAKGSCIWLEDAAAGIISGFTIRNGLANAGGGICCDASFPIIEACTFRNNHANGKGGGILCGRNSSPELSDCWFVGNSAHHGGAVYNLYCTTGLTNCLFTSNSATHGAAVFNGESTVALRNCTFSQNIAKASSGAISSYWDSTTRVSNCILWGDQRGEIHLAGGTITVTCSNVQGGWPGEGNIDVDPLFADPSNGDFHLKSQAGRWYSNSESWVIDNVTSPCIDAGDPDTFVGNEPEPNGERINMGAYGCTAEASKSP
jgi:hypothetical protein